MILLGIDTSFFFLELIVGMAELTAHPIPLVLTVAQAPVSTPSRWLRILSTWWVLSSHNILQPSCLLSVLTAQ